MHKGAPYINTGQFIRHYFRRYTRAFVLGGVFIVLTNAFGLAIPWLLKLSIDALRDVDVAGAAGIKKVGFYALLLAVAALAQMGIRIVSRLVIFGAGRDIELDVRNELLDHLAALPPEYYGGQSTGDIVSRASNDVGNLRLLYGPAVLNVVNTTFTVLSALAVMMFIDWRLTLLSLAPIPVVLLAIRKIAQELSRQFFEVQQYLGRLSGHISESLSGILVVKAFAREDWARSSFDVVNEENYRRNMGLAKTRGIMMPMMGAVGGLGTFVILLFGGQAVIAGRITLGDFVAFNGYLAMLVWPMLALGWVYTMIQRGMAAAARVTEVLGTAPEIHDPAAPQTLPQDGAGSVEFKNVTSRYRTSTGEFRTALEGVSFDVAGGGFLGITGPVGSGKSTLLRVLLRLQDIDAGSVTIDGIDIRELRLRELRENIGYVPQEPFLFSNTIAENLRFGRPDLSEDEMIEVTRIAGVFDDIMRFPRQFDTLVGERGVTLSGGQRQRIALARALAKNPRILLLDDALSAVDAETEERILDGLGNYMRKRTSLVATHRLAGIRAADSILVLEHGRVVERGNHTELLRRKGLYARLSERQQLTKQVEEA